MNVCALVVAFLLAGQINALDERYQPAGANQSGLLKQDRDAPAAGLVPLVGASPASKGAGDPPNSAATANSSADPYFGHSGKAGQSGQNSAPAGGVAPPPFRDPPAQPSQLSADPKVTPPPTGGLKPTAMMRAMLTAPHDSQLLGEKMTLIDVVANATSRFEQSQRVDAYWDLCSSVADYYLGLREQDELRRLRAAARSEGTAWSQAEAELAVRMDTSLKAARASQMRLATWHGSGTGQLPLPADQPHCGNYHSRYDEVFVGRPMEEGKQLSELLPLRYAELKGAAAAVTRAEEWLNSVARNEASDGTGTLRALEFLALRRRAFVQIARDYNRRIARYAELASPGEIGADRLIGMLIKTDNAATATRPESSAAPRRQSNNASGGVRQRTFADGEGWAPAGNGTAGAIRDEAVRPTSGATQQETRRERSVLVPPRL
jgi:hypothetical protein